MQGFTGRSMSHDNLPNYNKGRGGLEVVYDWIMGSRGFGASGLGFFGFGVGSL